MIRYDNQNNIIVWENATCTVDSFCVWFFFFLLLFFYLLFTLGVRWWLCVCVWWVKRWDWERVRVKAFRFRFFSNLKKKNSSHSKRIDDDEDVKNDLSCFAYECETAINVKTGSVIIRVISEAYHSLTLARMYLLSLPSFLSGGCGWMMMMTIQLDFFRFYLLPKIVWQVYSVNDATFYDFYPVVNASASASVSRDISYGDASGAEMMLVHWI